MQSVLVSFAVWQDFVGHCCDNVSDSELQCISDRKSAKLMALSAGNSSFSYTSSASLLATVNCRPTRVKIISSSARLCCMAADVIDGGDGFVALQSSVIANGLVLAKLFHSWNRLFDRFSKSKFPTNFMVVNKKMVGYGYARQDKQVEYWMERKFRQFI